MLKRSGASCGHSLGTRVCPAATSASRFVQQREAMVSMQPHTPATPGTIRPWLPNQSGRRSPWRAHCSPERAACLHPQRTVSLNGLQPQQLWAGLLGAHPSPALQPLRGSCPGLGGRGPLCPQERALALMDTGTYTAWGTGSRRGRLPLGTRGPSVFGCTSLKGAGWNVCTWFSCGTSPVV